MVIGQWPTAIIYSAWYGVSYQPTLAWMRATSTTTGHCPSLQWPLIYDCSNITKFHGNILTDIIGHSTYSLYMFSHDIPHLLSQCKMLIAEQEISLVRLKEYTTLLYVRPRPTKWQCSEQLRLICLHPKGYPMATISYQDWDT